jgi:uncharacterized repeat protein (TIGR01451 family)
MKKRAWLNSEPDNRNGTYPNPVAVLNSDVITYRITAINANTAASGRVIIRDTLPAYLDTVNVTVAAPLDSITTTVSGSPTRKVLHWSISGMAPYTSQTVSFRATPEPGAAASQPLFVNRAWVTVSDTLNIPTDSATYHQGAGVSIVTFSAAAGGSIFNAEPQAVDFNTAPYTSSLLVVPDSGYVFDGWSHPAYTSHRGLTVPAASGVMSLDTLLIYGNVELTAVFAQTKHVPNLVKDEDIPVEVPISQIWSSGNELLVIPAEMPSVLRIYTPEGVLFKQQTLLTKGVTKIKLHRGIYIVTLNNGTGVKIVIE